MTLTYKSKKTRLFEGNASLFENCFDVFKVFLKTFLKEIFDIVFYFTNIK